MSSRYRRSGAALVVALVLGASLPFLLAQTGPSGGLPSRPRFVSLGVGEPAPSTPGAIAADSLTGAAGLTLAGSSIFVSRGVETASVATVETGVYIGAVTGCTTDPAPGISWTKVGFNDEAQQAGLSGIVTLQVPTITCTSNATTFTVTGAPVPLRAAATTGEMAVTRCENNGAHTTDGTCAAVATIGGGITFRKNGLSSGWTPANAKGVTGQVLTYHTGN